MAGFGTALRGLARWESTADPYARVFGYDEEGRLMRIERDYGNGNKQVAYEYGYRDNRK